jgi:hypothetical protein
MLTAVLPGAAQNVTTRSLPNEPGKWRPWTFINFSSSELKLSGFTLPDARAFETRLEQIAEIFRASPIWNPPVGVDPSLTGMAFGPAAYWPYAKKLTYRPIAGHIMMGSFEHFEVVRTTGGQEQHERHIGDETMFVMFDVNSLPGGAGGPLTDDDGVLYLQPVRTADIGGFPTYGDLLVITTNGRPIWIPVSRERFLTAFIATRRPDAANAEKNIADQQKKYEAFVAPEATAARQAEYKAAIDKMASKGAAAVEHERRYWERDEADTLAGLKRGASHDPGSPFGGVIASVKAAEEQLATMPPAERSGPACFLEARNDRTKSGLVAMGTPNCVPLVTQNPNFFDPQLPRSVPQIIVVSEFRKLEKVWKEGRPSENRTGRIDIWSTYEVFRQADWQKVAGQIGK